MVAVKLDDKKFFYEVLNAGMKAFEDKAIYDNPHTTSEALGIFVRQLAAYGDNNHSLFKQAEEVADGFKEMYLKADLYFSLGVSRAIHGDHSDARRLLKKGIETQQQSPFWRPTTFCPAVIEARFYRVVRQLQSGQNSETGIA